MYLCRHPLRVHKDMGLGDYKHPVRAIGIAPSSCRSHTQVYAQDLRFRPALPAAAAVPEAKEHKDEKCESKEEKQQDPYYDAGEEKRSRRIDPREWDGVDMERQGDPKIGWPAKWDDARDEVIQTGMRYEDLFVGDSVEVWYRGFWWRATIFRRARTTPTVTIRFAHWPRATVPLYKPRLIRKA